MAVYLNMDRKGHWENIHATKQLGEVSWYEPVPAISLDFIRQFNTPKSAKIIDVGGGDSLLADHLLDLGYTNVTVLDISEKAIAKAQQRLGARAEMVKWIVCDATAFTPAEKYDFWHDRAAFHFLTQEADIEKYIQVIEKGTHPGSTVVIGTFSEQGPRKCSGIEIKQYSENSLADRLKEYFRKIRCIYIDHKTPSHTIQNFVFCGFRKIEEG